MESTYADRVESYGGQWHRPWLVLGAFLIVVIAVFWFTREKEPPTQVTCEPVPGSRFRAVVEREGVLWTADMEAALACASKHGRQVLVAFHAVYDTNARANEVRAFRDPRVNSALKGHVLVMLYIDLVPDQFYVENADREVQRKDGDANFKLLRERFGTEQEPTYAVVEPKGNGDFEIVAVYDEGRIKDVGRFIQLLNNPRSGRQ